MYIVGTWRGSDSASHKSVTVTKFLKYPVERNYEEWFIAININK
jgi:hypothetical protein